MSHDHGDVEAVEMALRRNWKRPIGIRVEAVLSALIARGWSPPGEWRPIESAELYEDEPPVDLWLQRPDLGCGVRVTDMKWHEAWKQWVDEENDPLKLLPGWTVTHWRPLPAPPQTGDVTP